MENKMSDNYKELAFLEQEESIKRQLAQVFDDDVREWINPIYVKFSRLMAYYRCAIMEVETKFNVLNEEFSLRLDRNPINSIKTRLKSFASMRDKLAKLGYPLTAESVEDNLHDVAGVRVICAFPQDVYTIANALLKQDDIRLIQKKDYIADPKPNGYRSLHLIVSVPIFLAHEKKYMKVEIQLRTIAMDVWASLEHQLRYKKDTEFSQALMDELLHCASLSSELDERMDAIRETLHPTDDELK